MTNPTTNIPRHAPGMPLRSFLPSGQKNRGGDVTRELQIYTARQNDPRLDLDFEAKLLGLDFPHSARLFIFEWPKPVLVLGRGQSMRGINEQICAEENIPVLIRHTGGSGVLHQHSLNIALVLDAQHQWTRRIDNLYRHFIVCVTQGLAHMGIEVTMPKDSPQTPPKMSKICFEADFGETLLLNGRKVFGCAQRRTKRAVLVHGSLLLGLDVAQQSRVFNVPEDRIARTMTCIPGNTNETALMDAIVRSFSLRLGRKPRHKGDYYG